MILLGIFQFTEKGHDPFDSSSLNFYENPLSNGHFSSNHKDPNQFETL